MPPRLAIRSRTDQRPVRAESFEDPFSIKLLPDGQHDDAEARYYNLGKSLQGKPVFSVFWTDGKRYRVVFARLMTPGEHDFFERKKAEDI
jgi:uncharacterized DUF497 family protein